MTFVAFATDPVIHNAILVIAGFIIGVFAVVFGGAGFFAVPIMQWLFPAVSFGTIIGNLKVGSFCRSVGSTASTHRKIEYGPNLKLSAIAAPGAALSSYLIADLDQRWLFLAILLAVGLTLAAPRVAHLVTKRTFTLAAFLTGVYAGLFGAGIGILLIALLRLRHPDDTEIGFVKIQARFVEWMLLIASLMVHFYRGNLVAAIGLPWSVGALAGGYAGGLLLHRIGHAQGKTQTYILYAVCAFALIVAGMKFF